MKLFKFVFTHPDMDGGQVTHVKSNDYFTAYEQLINTFGNKTNVAFGQEVKEVAYEFIKYKNNYLQQVV